MIPLVLLTRDLQDTDSEKNHAEFENALDMDQIPNFKEWNCDDHVLTHAFHCKDFIFRNRFPETDINLKVSLVGHHQTAVTFTWVIHRSSYHGNECFFSRYWGKLIVLDGAFTFEIAVATGVKGDRVPLVTVGSITHLMDEYQPGVTIGGRRQWRISNEIYSLMSSLILAKVNYDD